MLNKDVVENRVNNTMATNGYHHHIFYIGLAFWKSTARKIYAVKNKVKKEPKAVVVVDDNEKVIKDSQSLSMHKAIDKL